MQGDISKLPGLFQLKRAINWSGRFVKKKLFNSDAAAWMPVEIKNFGGHYSLLELPDKVTVNAGLNLALVVSISLS
jgi:hypothetical protein